MCARADTGMSLIAFIHEIYDALQQKLYFYFLLNVKRP